MVTVRIGDTPDDKREAWVDAVDARIELERAMVAAIQHRLTWEASHPQGSDPLALYTPSPGQLPDHVHHRIAVFAAQAVCEMFERQLREDRDA